MGATPNVAAMVSSPFEARRQPAFGLACNLHPARDVEKGRSPLEI
jgi:hypothetical protein